MAKRKRVTREERLADVLLRIVQPSNHDSAPTCYEPCRRCRAMREAEELLKGELSDRRYTVIPRD